MLDLSTLLSGPELELATRRWPDGPSCPRCAATKLYAITGRKRFKCAECRKQFGILTGTVLHSCKMDAGTILHMRAELAKGSHAYGLEKTVGLSSKTATSHVETREKTLNLLGRDIPEGEEPYGKDIPGPWDPLSINQRRRKPLQNTRRFGRHQKNLLIQAGKSAADGSLWMEIASDRKVVESLVMRDLMEATTAWMKISPKGILALSRIEKNTAIKAIKGIRQTLQKTQKDCQDTIRPCAFNSTKRTTA